ncbi:MAG: large conductance mechanosensitive channel protein MscL [Ruminococcus sp.]|nr:large conductance mechanosensitive channel protein MscL [Ruminococcus sp.]
MIKKFLSEFKEFALKGNVMDLAIGVIIGGAFSGLVTSLLDNIFSPIIGCFSVGGLNGLSFKIWKADLHIGAFINDVINFIIMALIVFLLMKSINKLMSLGKKKEEEEAPAEPSAEEKLLTEIRDLLTAGATEETLAKIEAAKAAAEDK